MSFLNPLWLKSFYEKWTDDDLHDRYREICTFGGNEPEKLMIELESKRRSDTNE